jgi:ABC-type branched-subunit amino acid transport system substrate-binding protein
MKRFAACLLGLALIAPGLSSAQSGVTPNSVLLGQSVALTGPAAALGIEMRMGAMVYFDYVNSKGGIHGRKIELRTLDDGYEPARTVPNTKKLIEEEKVFALFGYVGTPTSAAALPIFTQARVPFFGAFTGAELLRDPFNPYIFNVRASYYDETEKIVEQLVSTGAKNIAVFYQNDAYGQAGLKGVERAMTRRNLKISATSTVERNTIDVAAAVKAILAVQPDAVVMISAYTSCGEFIRQMKKAGSAAQFYNVSFVGSQALADNLGKEGVGVAISQVMPFPWAPSVPVVKEYQQLMLKAGHKDFTFTSVEGYVAAKVLVEGLRRAGKDLNRDKLIAALETMNDVDVGGYFVGFSPKNHNGSKFVDLTIIARDGKFMR